MFIGPVWVPSSSSLNAVKKCFSPVHSTRDGGGAVPQAALLRLGLSVSQLPWRLTGKRTRCTSPIQGKREKHGVLRSSCSKEIWGLHSILKPFWSQAFPLCASRPPPVGLSLSRIGTSTYLGKSQGHTGGAGSSQLCQDRGRLRKEVLRSKDILPELQKH